MNISIHNHQALKTAKGIQNNIKQKNYIFFTFYKFIEKEDDLYQSLHLVKSIITKTINKIYSKAIFLEYIV